MNNYFLTINELNHNYSKSKSIQNSDVFLNNLNFKIVNNEKIFLSITGNSASGKSTLINILSGRLVANKGFIDLDPEIKIFNYMNPSNFLNNNLRLDEAVFYYYVLRGGKNVSDSTISEIINSSKIPFSRSNFLYELSSSQRSQFITTLNLNLFNFDGDFKVMTFINSWPRSDNDEFADYITTKRCEIFDKSQIVIFDLNHLRSIRKYCTHVINLSVPSPSLNVISSNSE